MHASFRSLTALAASLVIGSAAAFAASSEGYVDFGKLPSTPGLQFVEVDLDGALLKLAAVVVDKKDAEIGKLVANLERVRVNVLGVSDETRATVTERVHAVRSGLVEQGWKRIVSVQEQKGDDVAVYVKQGPDDAVRGVVVTVISGEKEVVLVNVVGDVKLEQLAAVGERLNIDPLRKLDLAAK